MSTVSPVGTVRNALSGYNNLSQYRKDTWSTLEEAAERLASAAAGDRPSEEGANR